MLDQGQKQVQGAFGHKWRTTPRWGIHGETADVMTEWMMPLLGWADEAAYADFLAGRRRLLDAGCGNGRETIRMARLAPDAEVTGVDISDAVVAARENADGLGNVEFVQADLTQAPFEPGTFDYILSFGVLHHTPDTRRSFESLLPLLADDGEIAFYVYRRKAPIREFADDHLREALQDMDPDTAWDEMERLTLFARELSNLNAEIEVPEIPTLGIEAGRHDVQRLIYYTMLKCYWRDGWSLEENTHVNFDWYYPKYAWRHTADEVRGWLADNRLEATFFHEIEAGISVRARRA